VKNFLRRERVLQVREFVTEPYEYEALTARTNNDVGNPRSTITAEKSKAMVSPVSGTGRSEMPMSERDSASIDPEEFRAFLEHASTLGDGETKPLKVWLEHAETWQIARALKNCGGNRSAAARTLGIGRRTLYAKMEKLGITARWGL
jgi:DNA-binding NtrC family response regulator